MSLGTNNPFRARLAGAPAGPASPPLQSNPFSFAPAGRDRPKSRNPFLDVFDDTDFDPVNGQSRHTPRANSFDASAGKGSLLTGNAKELFVRFHPVNVCRFV